MAAWSRLTGFRIYYTVGYIPCRGMGACLRFTVDPDMVQALRWSDILSKGSTDSLHRA